MLEIGRLKLKSNLILAPMAGISDLPFRRLNRRFGCELAFVEMINSRSISHKSRRTQQMLSTTPEDRPLGIQLLGCEEKYILKAVDVLREHKFDLLDFNAACPAKKVVRRGEGASLLKEPKKLYRLLKLIVKYSSVPVSVKIRIGWDKGSLTAREVALYAQGAGVSAVFIHGRTKEQGYSGGVDYGQIRKVKEALEIPVVASGDILSAHLAKKMFDQTGCDGINIARGALGNPWIFAQAREYLDNSKIIARPSPDELISVMNEHLGACIDFYGEKNGIVIFRKFFAWYTLGLRKVRSLRERCSRAKTRQELSAIIASIYPLTRNYAYAKD